MPEQLRDAFQSKKGYPNPAGRAGMKITSADTSAPKRSLAYGVLVLACLVFFGMGISPEFGFCSGILFVLMLVGLYLGFAEVFLLGLTFGLILVFRRVELISRFWPLPTVLALAVALAMGKLVPFTKGAFAWLKRGELGRQQVKIIFAVAVISGVSLLSWYAIVKPDVSDMAGRIVHVHPAALVLIGLLFSMSNALCEEFVWRGMIFDALGKVFSSTAVVIVVQALSFGMAHLNGFPRGASGVVLASIYGCMMGYVRQNANGLLAPIAAHAFADAVIYSILVFVAHGRGI